MLKSTIKKFLADIQTTSYGDIYAKIDKHDEISFDIFDTIIKRDVPNPKDVFMIIEKNTGEKDFAQKRIQAEKIARSEKGEVKLKDIYEKYEGISEEKKQQLQQIEEEHELNLCQVNLRMLPIYQYACQKKRVLILSDMYLSRTVIEEILKKNHISGYEALIISNEEDKSKDVGSMYEYVKEQYECKNLLHIGNAFKADYLNAKRNKIPAVKIRTNTVKLDRKYRSTNKKQNCFLEVFLSNRHDERNDYYYTFGYERFGPVLYGFINWLLKNILEEETEQVLFMARDGYIMQEAYKILNYDQVVTNQYFEASRRSLRVPSYCESVELKDIMASNLLNAVSSIDQILDSLGLDPQRYKAIIEKYGFGGDKRFIREEIADDPDFALFYNEIKQDVLTNSQDELENLLSYLSQFDFSKKTAIVDIGWNGSMQRFLLRTLKQYNISNEITGYYFGLTNWSKTLLGANNYKAKGYLFDCLNDENAQDTVIPFRSLFETLFMEQKGSVKCYQTRKEKTIAIRYDYEFEKDGKLLPGALAVKNIHEGAIDFIKAFSGSCIKEYVGFDPGIMVKYIYQTGSSPIAKDLKMFGDLLYFNNGIGNCLAPKRNIGQYLLKPKAFLRDFSDAQWKVGFLKRTFKIPLPYKSIYMLLRKLGTSKEI